MESRYIAAIEIGSSKIKGIVASVDPTASIAVIAVEETDSGDSVRHGRVQNAREVAMRVNDIIRRLENNPRLAGGAVSSVFVSHGGRSMKSHQVAAEVRLNGDCEITPQILDKLHNEARYNLATDRDVLAICDRRFVVGNAEVKKIIGTFGNAVRGEFTIVTASPENIRNLDRVKIESHGADIPRRYIPRAIAVADMVLSDSERQRGSLLIDFGAESTTIAIYTGGALQLMATLPMGSANITRDLASGMGITDEAAENIKISKGRAVADRIKANDADSELAEINNYISARTDEIIANIINYIETSGFKLTDMPAGIVITGGGALLTGLSEMLETHTGMKVRRAAIDATIAGTPYNTADNAEVIAMVKYAASNFDDNCMQFRTAAAATHSPADRPAFPDTASGGKRGALDENDPRLLEDDADDFDQQPVNINSDDELPEPEPGETPGETRDNLLKRLRNWLAPKEDDLDNDIE